ncbi:hypothetical protein ACH42_07800 [Endozoicomonas sp. (ex Bugula neritina AB1)]|nr:hypothetical protein ACH42_07800 [Endozoicomonas sp. (ex Bugula neritina AB1)]
MVFFGFWLFSLASEAGFCWSKNNADCDLTDNGYVEKIINTDVETIYSGSDLNITVSEKFKFRSYCHENCSGGILERNWSIELKSICINGIPATDLGYLLEIEIVLKDQRQYLKWDAIGDSYFGGNTTLFTGGWSGDITPVLYIPYEELNKFKNGINEITFVFEGEDRDGFVVAVTKELHYTFIFDFKKLIQVEISGLDPVNLGAFPSHNSTSEQEFCVFATDGENFSIAATSINHRQEKYYLGSDSNGAEIQYTPYFSTAQSPEGEFALSTTKASIDSIENKLRGSSTQGCTDTGENMTLKIKLDESFQALSTKPAGTYTDTLTLTVAAE